MTVDDVTTTVIKVLKEVQRISGRPCGALTGGTTPIGELAGFDSLSGVEATVMIEAELGCKFKTDNVLVRDTDEGRGVLTITQAAEQIVKLAGSGASR
jgi:acyl carrier protein